MVLKVMLKSEYHSDIFLNYNYFNKLLIIYDFIIVYTESLIAIRGIITLFCTRKYLFGNPRSYIFTKVCTAKLDIMSHNLSSYNQAWSNVPHKSNTQTVTAKLYTICHTYQALKQAQQSLIRFVTQIKHFSKSWQNVAQFMQLQQSLIRFVTQIKHFSKVWYIISHNQERK